MGVGARGGSADRWEGGGGGGGGGSHQGRRAGRRCGGALLHTVDQLTAQDPWNRLDFVVLLSGMLSLLVNIFHADTKLQLMVILRFIRVGRAIRTFGRVPSLRTVVGVLFRTVHQLRVSFLFVIVLFIFSCLGEQLCAPAPRPPGPPPRPPPPQVMC